MSSLREALTPNTNISRVWQYVTLMKRIYMIDCPGVCPPNLNDTDDVLLLKGSIRVENVEYPAQYVDAVLNRVQRRHIDRTYETKDWTDATTFLELIARKNGRLLKGGEPDLDGCAKIVLNDYIRGKIPWFTAPPAREGAEDTSATGVDGREGRLGEMSRKRKRDGNTDGTESVVTADTTGVDTSVIDDDDSEFEGFSEDEGGLQIGVDEDGEDDAEDNDDGTDADDSDDQAVEEEVLAISKALATAKAKDTRKSSVTT